MAYSVRQSSAFESEMLGIIEYLADEACAPSAAERLIREVDHIADILKTTPYIKAVSDKPFLASRNLREYFFMGYVALYRVEGETVTFTNLFNQAQAYDSARYWE